jgi:hypothetical protein
MEKLARIVAIVRDLVWILVGVVLLVAIVVILAGGATQLLPAGGGGGTNPPAGGGAQPPGTQPPGGAPTPGPQQPPQGGSPLPPPAGGSPLPPPQAVDISVDGSGNFAGTSQGAHLMGSFTVKATQGQLQNAGVSFTVQIGQSELTFTGSPTCIQVLGTNPARAIVGGTIRDSNDATKVPSGSGFALGFADNTPDQISFEVGFSLSDASAICGNEATKLFTTEHPGFNLTSGDITIR